MNSGRVKDQWLTWNSGAKSVTLDSVTPTVQSDIVDNQFNNAGMYLFLFKLTAGANF
jgi:hypothetical protein